MKIDIDDIKKIEGIEDYKLQLDIKDYTLAQMYSLKDGKIQSNRILTVAYLNELLERKLRYINVIIPKAILKELRAKYPAIFPKAQYTETFSSLKAKFDVFQIMNKTSKKQRRMFLAEDIYTYEPGVDKYNVVAPNGEEVTAGLIRTLEQFGIKNDFAIDYNENEKGVLVFVPSTKNFKLRVDILAILANAEYEILDGETPAEAYKLYQEKVPKLVILGSLASESQAKEMFLYLGEYDPFAKVLKYDESPSGNRIEELRKIKLAYEKDYRLIVQEREVEDTRLKQVERKELTQEQMKLLLGKIKSIQAHVSVPEYVDTWFLVNQLSKTYDLKGMEIMLKRIRKTLPMYQND
ncbi:MAG: hypothetical protein HZC28_15160 [Spirochaetes bacterium]|nr:hypothetical protein [Spirochaetota bacterium]